MKILQEELKKFAKIDGDLKELREKAKKLDVLEKWEKIKVWYDIRIFRAHWVRTKANRLHVTHFLAPLTSERARNDETIAIIS